MKTSSPTAALIAATALAALAGCVTPTRPSPWTCSSDGIFIDAAFDGGNLDGCEIDASGRFVLTITPEDAPPINPSPWYAFRVTGPAGAPASIRIRFVDGPARYWPKMSHDRVAWIRVNDSAVVIDTDDNTLQMTVPASLNGTYIAGQEVHDAGYWRAWRSELAAHPSLSMHVVGQSRDGRPMIVFDSGADTDEAIILLGRQHPPEITGTLAMRTFMDTLLADTDLARRFRQRYRLVIAPWLNPDGVEAGNWRHNRGGVDLNRDWGLFTQPETLSVYAYIEAVIEAGAAPALMLDFHSTRRNLFYTQLPEDFEAQPDLATVWLNSAAERLPDYEFSHEARPASDQPNSKNFFFATYGIPAITYELGDETDRTVIDAVTPVFAETLMETLLVDPGT